MLLGHLGCIVTTSTLPLNVGATGSAAGVLNLPYWVAGRSPSRLPLHLKPLRLDKLLLIQSEQAPMKIHSTHRSSWLDQKALRKRYYPTSPMLLWLNGNKFRIDWQTFHRKGVSRVETTLQTPFIAHDFRLRWTKVSVHWADVHMLMAVQWIHGELLVSLISGITQNDDWWNPLYAFASRGWLTKPHDMNLSDLTAWMQCCFKYDSSNGTWRNMRGRIVVMWRVTFSLRMGETLGARSWWQGPTLQEAGRWPHQETHQCPPEDLVCPWPCMQYRGRPSQTKESKNHRYQYGALLAKYQNGWTTQSGVVSFVLLVFIGKQVKGNPRNTFVRI